MGKCHEFPIGNTCENKGFKEKILMPKYSEPTLFLNVFKKTNTCLRQQHCLCRLTFALQDVQQLATINGATSRGGDSQGVKGPLQFLRRQAKGWAVVDVHCRERGRVLTSYGSVASSALRHYATMMVTATPIN